jgi:flagellar hook-associated protein 2
MSGITSGIGIFSGIDTGNLIDQLIAVSSRPKILAQQRIVQLQSQQAAWLDLSGRLNALKTAAAKFNADKVFSAARAVSSNTSSLTAVASAGATPGAYSFIVDRIVGTQQLLSRGFADRNTSSIGATRFTIEPAEGRLDRDTALSELNGGQGISRGRIVITDSAGQSTTVDLSRVGTVTEVLDAINTAGAGRFNARVAGDRFIITDTAGGAGNLIIADAAGSTTATSLGIAGTATGGTLTGASVYRLGEGTALQSLNDGNGIRMSTAAGTSTPDFTITTRDGSVISIDIGNMYDSSGLTASAVSTLQGVIDRINTQSEGKVTASLTADGSGLQLVDNTTGDGTFSVSDLPTSGAAADLGIAGEAVGDTIVGRRLLAGLNSTLIRNLNGGRGLTDGTLSITARDGSVFNLSLPTDGSVTDLIEAIRAGTGGKIIAALDTTGTGLTLTDTTGGGGNLIVGGAAAAELGWETDPAGVAQSTLAGTRLQHRYVAESTLLSSLNGGEGIGTGSFEISDSTGATATLNIGTSVRTVGDLIAQINASGLGVRARINDRGDGILIEDSLENPGTQKIKITDKTGTVARRLNIAGEAAGTGEENVIDGSFERVIEFTPADTLDTLVTKINDANAGVRATVISDGSPGTPFRLSLTSARSGAAGRFTIDTGGFDLALQTLSEGTDARLFYGSADPARAVLLTSSTNTFDGVIANVRIDALSPSESPVTLTISRDTDAVESAIKGFVDAFNNLVSRIDTLTEYNAESQRRGTLLGDSTAQQLRASLFLAIESPGTGISGQFQVLSQIGIRVGSGGQLTLDTDAFRQALEQDPQGVANLLAAKVRVPPPENPDPNAPPAEPQYSSLGVVEIVAQLVERYTDSAQGILKQRNEAFDAQIRLQNDRIAQMDARLQRERDRLSRQFAAMERTIGQLQGQQGALTSLALMAATVRRY